ncbi:MAG: hypothetical protein Q9161_009754 [Pseudevernia consocians]
MVAFTAWYQRQEALSTTHLVNKAYGLPEPLSRGQNIASAIREALIKLKRVITRKQALIRKPTLEAQKPALPENRHTWTTAHGFYALMGGIAFEISDSEFEKFLPSKTKEIWFIGGGGIRDLIEDEDGRNIIPNLSEEEIKSKSKANGLAKALVCIQALWFIAQCLTRLAQRIPISLLELNTFGHAVCALLIYLLWWEKPFEVDYPTMTDGQILLDWRACFHMEPSWPHIEHHLSQVVERWKGAFRDQPNGNHSEVFLKSKWSELQLVNYQRRAPEDDDSGQVSSSYETQSEQETTPDEDNKRTMTILRPGEILQGTSFRLRSEPEEVERHKYPETFGVNACPRFPQIELTGSDITRWKMASRFVKRNEQARTRKARWVWNLFLRRCKDWPEVNQIFSPPIALGFSGATLIYGGLHALAWSANFDSFTEQLLWRMSACVVMSGFPICYFLFILNESNEKYVRHGTRKPFEGTRKYFWFRSKDMVVSITTFVAVNMYLLILLAYMLARAYLVIESFINLSHLPAGAYDIPRWSAYFPNFS